jgi:hypothetical protein
VTVGSSLDTKVKEISDDCFCPTAAARICHCVGDTLGTSKNSMGRQLRGDPFNGSSKNAF